MIQQDWLAARAAATPNKIAITFQDERISWQDLLELSQSNAAGLKQVGIQTGDHVGIHMPSSSQQIPLIFALMHLGAVIVPLNTRLSASELAWQIDNVGCSAVIFDEAFANLPDLLPEILASRCVPIQHINVLGTVEASSAVIHAPDDPLAIVHTSGTSGVPKGAVITYGNVFYSAMASAYRIGHLPDDKWLCVLPLYHVGGLSIIIRAVLYGITVNLYERFDLDTVNDALTHRDITLVSLVPTMLQRLLDQRQENWSSKLRLVLLGGGAPSSELVQRCLKEGIPLSTTYGLSEAASQVATATPQQVVDKPGTVGKPVLFTQAKIIDEEGRQQPTNTYGEIIIKGPTIMQGYYGNPESTGRAIRDGWLFTGDIGYLDADDDLFIVQRRSDLIVSGGENVYPAEVEGVLRQHPHIKEVAVVGVNDPEWGQRVAAVVVTANGHALATDTIQSFARKSLAGYKVPRTIKFVDELPQTANGKIERKRVKALFD